MKHGVKDGQHGVEPCWKRLDKTLHPTSSIIMITKQLKYLTLPSSDEEASSSDRTGFCKKQNIEQSYAVFI